MTGAVASLRKLPGVSFVLRALANPRLQGETAWVVFNKVAETLLLFVTLKLLTNLLSQDAYGEYNLALVALVLASNALLMPVNRAYLRHYHAARERGEERAVALSVLRWYAVASAAVLLLAGAFTRPLARACGLEPWTTAAAGVLFVGTYWRYLGVELMNLRRERRAASLHSIAFQAATLVGVLAALWWWERSATAALLASAAIAIIFALLSTGPWVRSVLAAPPGPARPWMGMVMTFGVPYAALLVLQWVQGFADRYLVAALMDFQSAAVYAAAFVAAGAPYMLFVTVIDSLLVPIAYQRCRDARDPDQVWAADQVLLVGTAAFVGLGVVSLPFYWFLGPQLLVLMTNAQYELSALVLTILALGRFLQSLTVIQQMFFAVHDQMHASLLFRVIGAAVTVPACWLGVRWGGLGGAAAGMLAAICIYVALLTFGPGGCYWLVSANRASAHRRLTVGGNPH
jgi:O-antigen/teichoic acid export membrane protein